ncbi:hypothetical protein SDC9_189713 [bioreactor metagenome]|uniref:Uncharacterized protein n=1 Tax=bioreactor metagenome TaxID=1076179 RepID=A0A645HT75_9ZZZZ
MHRDDVRVFQLSGQPRFAHKTFEVGPRPLPEVGHDRHRHFTPGIPVVDQQNALHPAETDGTQEGIPFLRLYRQRREHIHSVAVGGVVGSRPDHLCFQLGSLRHLDRITPIFFRPAPASPQDATVAGPVRAAVAAAHRPAPPRGRQRTG